MVLDRAAQRLVGGGDDAHVDLDRVGAADRDHAAGLEHAQQLGLQLERHLGDLVEEQRPLVRGAEGAGAVLVRPGERAADVPEQLALQEVGGSAAQLIARNGRRRLGESSWIARAISSLPLPVAAAHQHADVAPRGLARSTWKIRFYAGIARPHAPWNSTGARASAPRSSGRANSARASRPAARRARYRRRADLERPA